MASLALDSPTPTVYYSAIVRSTTGGFKIFKRPHAAPKPHHSQTLSDLKAWCAERACKVPEVKFRASIGFSEKAPPTGDGFAGEENVVALLKAIDERETTWIELGEGGAERPSHVAKKCPAESK